MNNNKIKEIMFNLFDEYEDCDDIIDALRSLETEQKITEEEYDYAMKYWDEILQEWEGENE